jgi:hypothetical protein
MKAPIANGTTKPAASEPFKAPKSNPGRQPNTSLVTESLGIVNPPAQDHGQPTTGLDSGDYNPSTMSRK